MVAVGIAHFAAPEPFVAIVPPWLPAPLALVLVSGFFEIALGLGLLHPRTRSLAGWGLVALYVAVFPANIHMAVNGVSPGPDPLPAWVLWGRLPLQPVFMLWAYAVSRPATR